MCKTFHVLPNDPLLKQLNAIQLVWIIANASEDAKAQAKLFKGQSNKQVSSQTFTNPEFDKLVNQLKNKGK